MKKFHEAEKIQYKLEGQGFEISIAQTRSKGRIGTIFPPKINNYQK